MKYDLSMLKKLSDNDESFILDMLQTFKRTAPPVIARMEEYASQQKIVAAGREAHKLIPGVSFLGAADLETVLKEIEEKGKLTVNHEELIPLIQKAKAIVNDLITEFENVYRI